jgi:fused signal recognition particle receptor
MDAGGLDLDVLIQVASVVGGLGLTGILGFLVVKRARAARLRQIEDLGGGEALAPAPSRRRGRRRLEAEAEPEAEEEAEEEAETDAEAAAEEADTDAGEAAAEEEAEGAPAPEAAPGAGKAHAEARAERGSAAAPASSPREDRATTRPAVPVPQREAEVIPFPRPAGPVDKPRPAPAGKPEPAPPPPAAARKGDGAALAPGLARTRAGWIARLGALFAGKKQIDPAMLDEVEKVLLTADIGVRTSTKLLEEMRGSLSRADLGDGDAVWAYLRRRTSEILSLPAPAIDWSRSRPFVLLIIGVNGSGKTTTIGKLAAKLIGDGKKVLLGAGDTFRAAAVEQLEIWAGRVGAPLVRGKEGADPSSVLFDATKRAASEGYDVVIADTAGRLHTKVDLMEELQKVRRVIGKAAAGAPHETWLVIDSTSGQNAIAQAQIFTQAMAVSGIVLTKLDGTAKGGVILGIADQLQIPVRYIGVGERVDDLRPFDPDEFVDALFTRDAPT